MLLYLPPHDRFQWAFPYSKATRNLASRVPKIRDFDMMDETESAIKRGLQVHGQGLEGREVKHNKIYDQFSFLKILSSFSQQVIANFLMFYTLHPITMVFIDYFYKFNVILLLELVQVVFWSFLNGQEIFLSKYSSIFKSF